MNFNSLSDIRQTGFEGFVPVSTLHRSNCSAIPEEAGVYLVLRPNSTWPAFLSESIGGHFKGKNPTVAINLLKSKWVEETSVLYIGKAGGNARATLASRMKTYIRFGQGEAVGHWGGRFIWQLRDSCDLLICWKATLEATPRTVEVALIKEFEARYRRLPFANLRH